MSRANYSDDVEDNWQIIIWRGAVASAIRGKRGQAFLKEMLAALDAMPEKRLIASDLEHKGNVCAIGSVGLRRGVDMSKLDPEDSNRIAAEFGIADALVREIEYENDEGTLNWKETPEQRWQRMRSWVERQIIKETVS